VNDSCSTLLRRAGSAILVAGCLPAVVLAQTPFTWQQIKDKFEAANPTLKAAQLNIDESRSGEVTAFLRPNPEFTGTLDQIDPLTTFSSPVSGNSVYRPLANTLPYASVSYLHEREHKRELRLESAKVSTDVAASTYSDQDRTLLFNLRSAFVQTLQAQAVRENARQNQVFGDVDSADVTLVSALNLSRPYRDKYLKLAEDSRDRISFSYQNGGASLLDYLEAEKAYRDTRLAYLNLIGSYLTAAAQMNMAVGREVIP
jgi:outer membrane protein TolC